MCQLILAPSVLTATHGNSHCNTPQHTLQHTLQHALQQMGWNKEALMCQLILAPCVLVWSVLMHRLGGVSPANAYIAYAVALVIGAMAASCVHITSRPSQVCVAVCCSVLGCVAVCCSVLQCVVVCCSVLQCVAANAYIAYAVALVLGAMAASCVHITSRPSQVCVAVCCSVLGCVL